MRIGQRGDALCVVLCLCFATGAAAEPLAHAKDRGVHVLQPGETAQGEDKRLVVNAGPAALDQSKPFVVTPVTHPLVKPCDRPYAQGDFSLGTARFDRDLSTALKAGRTVVVDLPRPFDQSSPPPPALSPWLSAAKAGGGAVTVSPYCLGGRGVFRDWLADVVAHLTGSVYQPARGYDVTLYADASKRQVTQVQFRPKSSAVAAN